MKENPQLIYEQQSVKNASPIQLVVKVYDLIIQATYREQAKRVRDLFSVLINGLDFDHEPADQLFALYRYCQDLSRKDDFDQIRDLIEPLRDTWAEVADHMPAGGPSATASLDKNIE